MSTRGQSIGTRWLRMKVVRVDGSDVDFVPGMFLRSWVLLGVAALLGAIGIDPVARLLNTIDRCAIGATAVIESLPSPRRATRLPMPPPSAGGGWRR